MKAGSNFQFEVRSVGEQEKKSNPTTLEATTRKLIFIVSKFVLAHAPHYHLLEFFSPQTEFKLPYFFVVPASVDSINVAEVTTTTADLEWTKVQGLLSIIFL